MTTPCIPENPPSRNGCGCMTTATCKTNTSHRTRHADQQQASPRSHNKRNKHGSQPVRISLLSARRHRTRPHRPQPVVDTADGVLLDPQTGVKTARCEVEFVMDRRLSHPLVHACDFHASSGRSHNARRGHLVPNHHGKFIISKCHKDMISEQ